jgi:superfamily II DNA/RNA helicase
MVAALSAGGVTVPFPIQSATLPDALAGRDVLGRGQTGSGKTIAFAVPVVAALMVADYRRAPGRPGALVLVPTRELAAQVAQAVRPLAEAMGLRCATVYGGVPQGSQTAALRRGADIVVATPGRLEDLIAQGHCRLGGVRTTVLDEADHMADLGFLPAVKRLLDQTPPGTQRLLFSATLDNAVNALVQRYLHHPAIHSVDPPESSPAHLEHHLFNVQAGHKAAVVTDLASGAGRSLLFTRTKHAAKKLARQLSAAGIPAVDLHGNLAQGARDRNLAAFTDGTIRVLVATDIAARGIHVDDVALVVHVDPPAGHKAYLHRSGRTARAGAAGVVVTIVTPDQVSDVKSLIRQAAIHPRSANVVPGDAQTTALTGPPSERRPPPAPVVSERQGGRQTTDRRPATPVGAPRRPRPRPRPRPSAARAGGAAGAGGAGGAGGARRSAPSQTPPRRRHR